MTTGESKLTERKVVSQTTYVTGIAASYQSDADASLAAACTDAGAKQQAIAGAKFLDAVCAPDENVSTGSNYLMGAPLHGAPAPDAKQTMLSWGFGAEASLVVPLGRVVALTFGPTLAFSKTDAVAGEPAPTQSSVFLGVNGAIALTL